MPTFTKQQTCITVRMSRPHQAIVGVPSNDINIIQQGFEMLKKHEARSPYKMKITEISFIPFYGGGVLPSIDEWLEARGKERTEETVMEFLSYISDMFSAEQIDEAWNSGTCSTLYTFRAAIVNVNGETLQYPDRPITFEYQLTPALRTNLAKEIRDAVEGSSVYVSGQLLTCHNMATSWPRVEQLVKEHLVMRERFVVHEYDTQTHPANYFYIPYYGIPIGIMRQWRSHIIRKADYVNYMNSLLAPMIETKNMGIYLQETSPMMAFSAPYIYGQKSFEDSIIRIQDGLKSSYEHGRASQNGQSKGVLGWLKSFKK